VLSLSRVSIAAVVTGAVALGVVASTVSSAVGPHVLSGHGSPAVEALEVAPVASPTPRTTITTTTPTSVTPSPSPTTPSSVVVSTPPVVAPPVPPVIDTPPARAAPVPVNPITLESAWASAVLAQLNSERAQNGLAPLTASGTLIGTAHAHNLLMAQSNTMSHQLPGEATLGDRISAARYDWRSVGENVGWTTNRSQAGAMSIETQMYNETPPEDGHRLNILSTVFTQVGIDVIVDSATGRLWLTEDFGQPV
jgi:uncharacterized protein YkwD